MLTIELNICVDMLINFPGWRGRCCAWTTLYGRNSAIPMIPYCNPCHKLNGSVGNIAMHACASRLRCCCFCVRYLAAPVNKLQMESERLHS